MGVRWIPFPFEVRECEKQGNAECQGRGSGTDRIRQMKKKHPVARIFRYRSFHSRSFFVPTWLNRDRIGAFRSGGGVLLAWPWFAVEGI